MRGSHISLISSWVGCPEGKGRCFESYRRMDVAQLGWDQENFPRKNVFEMDMKDE